jgi:hypothetical protein
MSLLSQTLRPRIPIKAPVRLARMVRQFSSAFNRGRSRHSVARRATVTTGRLRIRISDHLAPATRIKTQYFARRGAQPYRAPVRAIWLRSPPVRLSRNLQTSLTLSVSPPRSRRCARNH